MQLIAISDDAQFDGTGPITLSSYEKFQWIRDQLEKEGINVPLSTGN